MTNKSLDRRHTCMALGALFSAGLLPKAAIAASEFPSKPVTFITPFLPGTTGDQWARMVAPRLSEIWKQPVIVENKPGAGTMIGVDYVRRAQPDGHTLLLGSLSTAMAKLTNATVQFDPQVELSPVCKYMSFKIALATNAATYAKAKTLGEMVALSKSTPDGVFFGGTGPGTAFNMSAAFVLNGVGARYSEVNYNGTQPITIGLIRNDVQIMANTPAAMKAHVDSGALFPIAALGEERFSEYPQVQTVREAGLKGFYPVLWNAVYAPKGTPLQVRERIARDIYAVSSAPDMKPRIESIFSGFVVASTPQTFAKDLENETREWRQYLTSINFKPQ